MAALSPVMGAAFFIIGPQSRRRKRLVRLRVPTSQKTASQGDVGASNALRQIIPSIYLGT